MKLRIAVAALAMSILAGGSAQALTVIAVDNDVPVPSDQQLAVDFDGYVAPGFNLVLAGPAAIYDGAMGLVEGVAAPPPGTDSHYLAIQQGGSATLFTPTIRKLSVYIGSPDSFNTIRFIGLDGFDKTLTGAELAAGAFNGDQSVGRRMIYDFGDARVNQVVFGSNGSSFELDNVAVGLVPEPGSWALMIVGMGLLGATLRRRVRADVA